MKISIKVKTLNDKEKREKLKSAALLSGVVEEIDFDTENNTIIFTDYFGDDYTLESCIENSGFEIIEIKKQ